MPHFNPADVPEGAPAEVVEHLRRHHMEREANIEEMNGFIRSLSPSQLFTFISLVNGMVNPESGPEAAARLAGVATGVLIFVHNRCLFCGYDHEKELLDPNTHEKMNLESLKAEGPCEKSDTEVTSDSITNDVDVSRETPDGVEPWLTYSQTKDMVTYNLDDIWEMTQAGAKFRGFICKNCGQIYPSIEDRKLTPPGPEGCGGCRQKMKWG